MYLQVILISFLSTLYFSDGAISDNPCGGDWTEYKEEKCLKIFHTPGLVNYAEAGKFCEEKEDSHLITIGAEEEQKFVENFLKSNDIVDNVWIGLKYVDDSYEWIDGTGLQYTNWGNGSPKNNSDNCIQMSTEITDFGSWSDASCSKKNLVLCEKIQLWSLTQIQTTLMNLVKNPVPLGFIYVQLPKEKSPSEIWPWLDWKDVSLEYESVFFRVAGRNSSGFGLVQEENSPKLTGMDIAWYTEDVTKIEFKEGDTTSPPLGVHGSSSGNAMRVKVTGGEVRPRNMSVKIWKRMK